jgi:hypothetical protein
MDPYLEASWRDVHASLVVYAANELAEQLPQGMVARINTRQSLRMAGDIDIDTPEETYIEILEAGKSLVTAIEFMTPTTKAPQAVDYRRERTVRESRGVAIVEIDVLRGEDWIAWLGLPAVNAAYRVMIRRGGTQGWWEYYPIQLRDPLPVLPIPARDGQTDLTLRLQALVARAYDLGRYARTINYLQSPVPPLEGDDAVWADQLLKDAGKR